MKVRLHGVNCRKRVRASFVGRTGCDDDATTHHVYMCVVCRNHPYPPTTSPHPLSLYISPTLLIPLFLFVIVLYVCTVLYVIYMYVVYFVPCIIWLINPWNFTVLCLNLVFYIYIINIKEFIKYYYFIIIDNIQIWFNFKVYFIKILLLHTSNFWCVFFFFF